MLYLVSSATGRERSCARHDQNLGILQIGDSLTLP
jgi:hypothetical protein